MKVISVFTLSSLVHGFSVPFASLSLHPPTRLFSLNSDTAVVCIEYQNEFTSKGGKLHEAVSPCMEATGMMTNTLEVVNAARQLGAMVVHVPISFPPDHTTISGEYGILANVKEGGAFEAGTWGAEICKDMTPQEGDIVVGGKTGLCGFASTNLDMVLRQNSIKNVALCGFLCNCCVESTMRTAYELGYNVKTLTDCVAATSVEAREAAVEHNFGMFSTRLQGVEFIKELKEREEVFESKRQFFRA